MREQKWKLAWRAIANHLALKSLIALEDGLENNDSALCQGSITIPDFTDEDEDYDKAIIKANAVGYALWKGHEMQCIGDIHAIYHTIMRMAEQDTPKIYAVHTFNFTGWYDKTAWDVVRRELLEEVRKSIKKKQRLYQNRR